MFIQAFLNEFEKMCHKTKSYGTVQLGNILAYRLLKSGNLSNHHEELITATIPELQYDLMRDVLKEMFRDASRHASTENEESC